ncbi:hypothetical protein CRUP_027891, partial [Coryphaenoides rupestris]
PAAPVVDPSFGTRAKGTYEASEKGGFGSGVGLRYRPSPHSSSSSAAAGERWIDVEQVRAVQASLQRTLGPYEPLLTYLQSVFIWERPLQLARRCCRFTFAQSQSKHVVGSFPRFVSALNPVLLVRSAMMARSNAVSENRPPHGHKALVGVPNINLQCVCAVLFKPFRFFALTSLRLLFLLASGTAVAVWGLVHPGLLSVPELCHYVAEAWFCLLACTVLSFLAMVGRYIPGLVLAYSAVLGVLLAPLAATHRLVQHVIVRLEPVLQRLDFSVRGYMMSKPIDNQFLRRAIRGAASGDGSDSEEELAAFCPSFDDAIVAKELALSDSEHSDAEASYTDNGTFNLDAEESFAQDLQDFPTINPDATLMDDDEDTSIGLPSMGFSELASHRASLPDMDVDSDQEDLELAGGLSLTDELAGVIASNMIQAALAGALQPARHHRRAREGPPPPRAGARRSYHKQSSSELDTDWDGEDFEMLDQSELNQMDPCSGTGSRRGDPGQGSNFLSNLLGKP